MSAEDDINIEDEVKAFLASDEMDRTADYCARGRPHKHLEQSAPLKAWITAFEAVADAVDAGGSGYLAARQREGDLASEIKLREGEPPHAEVKDATNRLCSVVRRMRSDPETMQRLTESLEPDFVEFLLRRDSSS